MFLFLIVKKIKKKRKKKKKKKTKARQMSAKNYNRKPNIEQHFKRGLNSDAPEGQKVTAPIVEPVKRYEHYIIWILCWTSV